MSDEYNPYQSPRTEAGAAEPLITQPALTETMLQHLRGASPWLRFMGIIGYIGSGFLVVGGISAILTGVIADAAAWHSFLPGNISIFIEAISGITGLVNIAAGAVSFFPARFAYTFGAKIRDYCRNSDEQELERAFKSNKSLWKFNGIMAIAALAFIPVMILIAIIAAAALV
ncbi:MAG: hypothetical protein LBD13_02310 [Spirochaetaceae bacterium]|jgi:hypothetical protein|nr:hypothetical protein [Spirochaetaceae bacterium]